MVTKASKGLYLLIEQEEITQSDVEDHRGLQVRYSSENPSFMDCEANAVDERCLKEYRTFFHIPLEVVFRLPRGNAAWNPPQGTYTDQPKLTKDDADRVSQAVQTSMDSRNFRTLVTAEKLTHFGLTPELINNRNHILDLDPILGKTIHALKNMKTISKEDAKATEKQGIAPPDDSTMAEGLDSLVPTRNAATAGSHVTAIASKTKTDDFMRGKKARTGSLHKRKREDPPTPKGPKTSRTLSIPLQSKKGGSELTGGSQTHFQDSDFSVLPDRSLGQNVLHLSATIFGFFGGEGSARPAVVETTRSLLSDPNHLDSTVALRWAMTGELTFEPAGDFECFQKDNMTESSFFYHGKPSYAYSMPYVGSSVLNSLLFTYTYLLYCQLLRKCDSAIKDREKLNEQVNRLVEKKTKLLADNAKLLANQGTALSVEKKKNEESSRRVAALEKQRDSLSFHLREYERDFQTAKSEIGIRAISLLKHSPAFKAFAHKKFMKRVDACKDLVRSLDHPAVAEQIDESMRLNLQEAELDLQKQSGNEDFRDDGTQGEGDQEDDDQVEEEEDEEVPAEDFQGDIRDDIVGLAKDGGES
ncbi:hypothetical protein LWI29_031911 [Acer saccharum]|uniref:Uncharacterized protein n=1 Tax=Acer saccharum TaxID=4024 RepID=A0AA39SVV5_ACESA|nr:hypothetical protein LWI29_031911 [Acer saccharum]